MDLLCFSCLKIMYDFVSTSVSIVSLIGYRVYLCVVDSFHIPQRIMLIYEDMLWFMMVTLSFYIEQHTFDYIPTHTRLLLV